MPCALLQVHYHRRAGGVTTVMKAYADAFAGLVGDSAVNAVLCARENEPARLGAARVIDTPAAAYRECASSRSYLALAARIERTLRECLAGMSVGRPVLVVGHNLNLGRNIALTRAFRSVARDASLARCARFVLVVHDRPEDGRWRQLRHIEHTRRFDPDVWNALYPSDATISYVSPSPAIVKLLTQSGRDARLLWNPVALVHQRESGAGLRARMRRKVAGEMAGRGVRLRGDEPLVLYPTRIIGRKNPFEAAIVACLVMRGVLMIGRVAVSGPEVPLGRRFMQECMKLGLPVLADSVGWAVRSGAVRGAIDSIGQLAAHCDACLSTSVREGFGYALYEPYGYGTPVLGRRPWEHVSVCGVDHHNLYDCMVVPEGWQASSTRTPAQEGDRVGAGVTVAGGGVPAGMVDFAHIGMASQARVLRRLVREQVPLEQVMFVRKGRIVGASQFARSWRTEVSGVAIAGNRRAVTLRMGREAFSSLFARLLLRGWSQTTCPT